MEQTRTAATISISSPSAPVAAATSYGASAAVCELPFSTISSDTAGGVGGTGCVPKKLLVYASKYTHEFEDSHSFGWKYDTEPSHDWSTLIANKNAELQRLTAIYKCP
ncbi:hypothetical protein YC2023_039556 [Brassica napus]|uniref:Uncharacterized protein n=1 Tax=Brassica cretica TaxID=69181 RepID=A0ABQ7CEF3_BRACR|nr:hypothetical protein DY000_02004969 [Brassica cretica]